MAGPKLGDLVLDGRYQLLEQVQGSVGSATKQIGSRGSCRYCGLSGKSRFRKVAHSFPEALGNQWIISLDECDDCNAVFSAYESALTSALGPLLTLGGVRRKSSSSRQVGRSGGSRVLKHSMVSGGRQLSIICKDLGLDGIEPQVTPHGTLRMKLPIAATPFKPRDAYKALTKMGLALLPNEEIQHFECLRGWISDADDRAHFRSLNVAMSFASMGNAPELVSGTLLRRVNDSDPIPYILFVFCAGSVCLQIDLKPDRLDSSLSRGPTGAISIRWSNVVQDPEDDGRSLKLGYGDPRHIDWSSSKSQPQPIEFFWLEFDPRTCEGNLDPVMR